MRRRIVLVLVGFCVLFSTEILFGKKQESPAALSVRQQVDSEIHNLKRNLSKMQKSEDAWKAVEKSEKVIQSLRAQNARQFEADEVYLDTLMGCLDALPHKVEFKKERCDSYRTQILAQFDPRGEDSPSPPVAKALEILKEICR